jgi:hypothetical protein
MVTYTSLFDCEPSDIINGNQYSDFTPYQYGQKSTKTEMPKYGTGTDELYINVASIDVKLLDSNTPFMILVTAENQFG